MVLNESIYLIRVTVFLWLKIALHGKLAHFKYSWENHFASHTSLKLFERLLRACFKILTSEKSVLPFANSSFVLQPSSHRLEILLLCLVSMKNSEFSNNQQNDYTTTLKPQSCSYFRIFHLPRCIQQNARVGMSYWEIYINNN